MTQKTFLEEKLSKYIPKILEINLISKELKRNVLFNINITYNYIDANLIKKENENKIEKKNEKRKFQIRVQNKEENQIYIWSLSKFSNRYYIIKEILEKYFDLGENLLKLTKEEDVLIFYNYFFFSI